MSLKDLNLKKEYRSPRDNVVKDFYIPVMKEACLYKRSVGFFSSTSLIEISYGITNLINNDGKIQLIVSPNLSIEDIDAINKGYELRDNVVERYFLEHITDPKDYYEEERLNLLATLIAKEKLDIKIAFSLKDNDLGLYHEKLGLMYDKEGNKIAFSGSMNESEMAFSHNYETIDVYNSWDEEDRFLLKEKAFEELWYDNDIGAKVFDFPEAAKNRLLEYKKENIDLDIDNKQFFNEEKVLLIKNEPIIPNDLKLYEYQKNAINNWKDNNYIGIFDMATGTGKTYTGLGAIVELFNNMKRLAVIIVCPYKHLVNQWVEDILKFNIEPIVGHGESHYRNALKNEIFDYNLKVINFFCFICTNRTFSSDFVQQQISNISDNILLVVDEAHNFGSNSLVKTLDTRFDYRLALSATLERYGDETGTRALLNYFDRKCIEFSLEDAIKEGFLTPYQYHPIVVYLTDDELIEYHALSREIARCLIMKNGKTKLSEKGKIIAQKRSRLIAGAYNKISALAREIKPYKDDNHILVYCGAARIFEQDDDGEDLRQIDAITKMLGTELSMNVAQFTSREDGNMRKNLTKRFAEGDYLQALVAIKCLDEGVNIPAIKTAFILASTTNPKEYIQRRGRVLRKSPGKDFANIYDFIILPRPLEDAINRNYEEIKCEKSMVKNEVNRMKEFNRLAISKMEADKLIYEITDTYKLYDDIIEDEIEMEEFYDE